MIARASSGSRSCSSSVEPLISANSAVTVLRSPSSASDEALSGATRTLEVDSGGDEVAAAALPPIFSGVPHLPQKSEVGGFSALHFAQFFASEFPHFAQKLFVEGLFVPHLVQRINRYADLAIALPGVSWHSTNLPPFIITSRFARSCSTVMSFDRIAVDDQQVGQLAGFDGSEVVLHSEQFGAVARRPSDHVEGRNARAFDVRLEFLRVVAVRHRGGAEIVADQQLDASRVRLAAPSGTNARGRAPSRPHRETRPCRSAASARPSGRGSRGSA